MAIFNSYVKLPEGTPRRVLNFDIFPQFMIGSIQTNIKSPTRTIVLPGKDIFFLQFRSEFAFRVIEKATLRHLFPSAFPKAFPPKILVLLGKAIRNPSPW